MRRLRYSGKDTRIQGATALVRDDPATCSGGNFGMVLVQFDCPGVILDGARMGFGWHLFNREDWT